MVLVDGVRAGGNGAGASNQTAMENDIILAILGPYCTYYICQDITIFDIK